LVVWIDESSRAFITRRVLLRAMVGIQFPVTSGCDDAGKACDTTGGARYVGFATGLLDAFDIYYAGANAGDTELVIRPDGVNSAVLVRIPGAHKMVVLRKPDCRTLDVSLRDTAYAVNDETGVTGRITLDCERPEIGHVTGSATFTCF
jgi:hypothetical protein